MRGRWVVLWAGCWLAVAPGMCAVARGQPAPDYDFDWVTIRAPGNPAYMGINSLGQPMNRGSVAYEFRIARMEVTTAQWMEYVNTFSTQSDALRLFGAKGAGTDSPTPAARMKSNRPPAPAALMLPIANFRYPPRAPPLTTDG